MGRSVFTPSDAVWAVELDYEVDTEYYECTRCGHAHYDADAPEQCEECGLTSDDARTPFLPAQYDADLGAHYWDAFVSNITDTLSDAFPPLKPYTNSASDREYLPYSISRCNESRPLLINQHAVIGVSEYCDVVAIWCVPLSDATYQFNEDGLHARWARSVERRAKQLLKPLSHSLHIEYRKAA